MKESGFVRGITMGLVAAAAMVMSVDTAQAQSKTTSPLFPNGLSGLERNRMFMRLGYTNAFIRTKAGNAYDVNGPLITSAELKAAAARGQAISDMCNDAPTPNCSDVNTIEGYVFSKVSNDALYAFVDATLIRSITDSGMLGLGTPMGVSARAQRSAGTPTVSLGYWLDEDQKWLAEAFLLAVPLSVTVYGDGKVQGTNRDVAIAGKPIVTTKLLPPLVIGSYNFGSKDSVLRPYVGVGAMYAVFFNTKATTDLEKYVGGKTSVSSSNAFGVGPFAGLQTKLTDDWHINFSVGQIKLKSTATLVTRDTVIRPGDAVLADYPTSVSSAIAFGERANVRGGVTYPNSLTSALTALVADTRGASNLGSATRKQDLTLTNTIVTLSVGRSF